MKPPRISRRKFITTAVLATPLAALADAHFVEPDWLKVRRLTIGTGTPTHRLVHFSDVHHKGDTKYLKTVIDTINSLSPDFVCFTGDIMEEGKFLDEALKIFSGIKAPLFGVPGNHDYWSGIPFAPVYQCFQRTGGAWLTNRHQVVAGGKINLVGIASGWIYQPKQTWSRLPIDPEKKNILLMHYPAWANNLGGQKFDLMLAGHSHGGQVRIPFYGPIVVPYGVADYDMGLYQTQAGPLYVNPGIGYIGDYDLRFNCRPEITVIEV